MGSLILLMISIVVSGIGFQFVNWRSQVTDELDGGNEESGSREESRMDRQDKSLERVLRSYLFWIAIAGILISIGLSWFSSK